MTLFAGVLVLGTAFLATPEPNLKVDSPPPPLTGKDDWVLLTSGEWLNGDFEDLQDDVLVFDSKKLDTLELDFDDVHAVYIAAPVTCLFGDRTICQGIFTMTGETVTVQTSQGEVQRKREALRSVIHAENKREYWSGKWSMGLTFRSGNTEQRDLASFLTLQRRSAIARTRLDVSNSYGVSQGQEVTSNHLANLSHDTFLTRRLYVPASLQYYRDRIKNVDHSLTPSIGLGYEVLHERDIEWNVDMEGGYQYTRYDSVFPGAEGSTDGASFLVGTRLSWDVSDTVEFSLQYDTMVGLAGYVNTDHHALAQLSFDLWKGMDWDVSLGWDRIGGARQRSDGTIPEADDVRLVMGIGFDF